MNSGIDVTPAALADAMRRQARRGFELARLSANDELLEMAASLAISQGASADLAIAFDGLLGEAVEELPKPEALAARHLLGRDPSSRRMSLTQRRARAAESLGVGEETFRKNRELRLLEELAGSIIARAAERRMRRNERDHRVEGLIDQKRVLLIHGADQRAADATMAFLRALGLHPVTMAEAITETGFDTPRIVDAIRAAIDVAQAVVVLLTPSELGESKTAGAQALLPSPNVVFEAGLATGMEPRRTIVVAMDDVDLPSDLQALNVLRLQDTPASRNAFRFALQNTGLDISSRGSEWIDPEAAGAFESVRALVQELRSQVPQWIHQALATPGAQQRFHLTNGAEVTMRAIQSGEKLQVWLAIPTLQAPQGLSPRVRAVLSAIAQEAFETHAGPSIVEQGFDWHGEDLPEPNSEVVVITGAAPPEVSPSR